KKVIGPILTMALGTLILGGGIAWYFWPPSKMEVVVEELPKKELSIPNIYSSVTKARILQIFRTLSRLR
ncbi:MAG: hypothetical protein WA231_05270, partial [Methylocella sp.]